MKHLLHKEGVKANKYQATYAEVFEKLSNQQEFKHALKEALGLLSIKGEFTLLQFQDNKFKLVGSQGNKEKIEEYLENKKPFKHIRETKKPYFYDSENIKFEDFYIMLPIVSRDELLGVFCIHEKQPVVSWDELYLFLHFIAVAFKYYSFIELTKEIDIKDVVTSLFNYRHFNDQLEIETEKSRRYSLPLSLVMIDVENFKMINEKLGYDAGDEVLKQIGIWLKKICRRVDMPARLEADKFAVLLSNTDEEGANILLERIQIKIKNNPIVFEGKEFKIRANGVAVGYDKYKKNDEFLAFAQEKLKKN